MQKLNLIKIPLHIIPLFLSEGRTFYAQNYSKENTKVLKSAFLLDKKIKFSKLQKTLQENKFEKVDKIESYGQFGVRGDTISVWPLGYQNPLKFAFFGEDCEEIYTYDEYQGNKISNLSDAIFTDLSYFEKGEESNFKIQNSRTLFEVEVILFTNKKLTSKLAEEV